MSVQGEEYCASVYGGEWKQTSETGAFRKIMLEPDGFIMQI